MTSRTWVDVTTEYNTRLRKLTGGAQLVPKTPRALLEKLGDIEPKIAERRLANNFTSAAVTTKFWTLHCKARCKTIKYPGPSGAPENHKLSYCSDGFNPAVKDDILPVWPLPSGMFTFGRDFHPLMFLAHVRELYEALVTHEVKREDLTMEQETFYQLLASRTVVDMDGAVMFKLFKDFTVPTESAVPDMYVVNAGWSHLYINSRRCWPPSKIPTPIGFFINQIHLIS
ncbi:hypothetical protein DFH06DRAFT_989526 [Mycena polygramma]|nr:hypothetical protein DFH06DRAFT_989526 [Mycena polygramma]